jgi:zinc transporter ZupT
MKNENIENWKIIKALIIISLLTPIGSISAGYFLQFQGLIPIFMSISAGTFIYISMTEIIPELHKDKNIFMPFILLSGYLFVFIIHIFMEH